MSDPMEKKIEASVLLSCYGPLLTETQQALMRLYYDEDYSLAEIAAQHGVSRQSVHDTLSRSLTQLTAFEEKLHLLSASRKRSEALEHCIHLADALPEMCEGREALIDTLSRLLLEEEK